MYKKFFSPILFLFDPEKIHNLTFLFVKIFFKIPLFGFLIKSYYTIDNQSLKLNLFGLNFNSPIGIAAGFDKNATHISEFAKFGFQNGDLAVVVNGTGGNMLVEFTNYHL